MQVQQPPKRRLVRRVGGHNGKELAAVRRRAHKAGWRVEWTGSGHLRWFDPEGHLVTTTSGTPSAGGVHFALVALKKAGL
jgi:hypothetical protein